MRLFIITLVMQLMIKYNGFLLILFVQVGMPNIREYESSKMSRSEELLRKKRDLVEHKSKLEAALAYETSRDLTGPLDISNRKVNIMFVCPVSIICGNAIH